MSDRHPTENPQERKDPEGGSPQADRAKDSADLPDGEQSAKAGGIGDEAKEATSGTGSASRRDGYLRAANRQTFGGEQVFGDKVGGDQVYGDKNYYLGATRRRAQPSQLSSALVKSIRVAFVGPEGWDEVNPRVRQRTITILTGRRGWGKPGAAIRSMLGTPGRQLFQLDQGLDFADLADQIDQGLRARSPEASCVGFLFEEPRQRPGLTCSALQEVEETLAQAGAQLILTIGEDLSSLERDLNPFVIDLPGPPDFKLIVAHRLAHEIEQDNADKLLAEPANREFITKMLAEDASCSRAAALADELAAEYRNFADGAEFKLQRVRQRVRGHGASVTERWFARLPDTRARALAISLAVLSGLSYECVSLGSLKLLAKLDLTTPSQLVMSSGDDIAPEGIRPFRTTRRQRLEQLGARSKLAEIPGQFGTSRSEIMEYENHDFAVEVLQHAWSGFDVQEILLRWLKELAEDSSEQVRIQAGLAIGQLAFWSFEYLCGSVLLDWAKSDLKKRREAVAYALSRIVSPGPALHRNAWLLAARWHGDNNPNCQATVARVYGLALGRVQPLAAIDALTRLLAVDDIKVTIAAGDGIADLLAADLGSASSGSDVSSGELVTTALTALIEAMADRKRAKMAQLASLMVTGQLVTNAPGQDGTDVEWPALLWLTVESAQAREPVVAIWRQLINVEFYHPRAEAVMRSWAWYAEDDQEIRTSFLRLARAIARGQPRCRAILNRYAEVWASSHDPRPLPNVSADLQTLLAAESEAAWPTLRG